MASKARAPGRLFWGLLAVAVLVGVWFGTLSRAEAFPGNVVLSPNTDGFGAGKVSWGYITTQEFGIGSSSFGCGNCHFAVSTPTAQLPPTNLTLNGVALASNPTFNVQAGAVQNFSLQFTPGATAPNGGFIVFHNDTSVNDDNGTLMADTGTHQCKGTETAPPYAANRCGTTTGNNTEVMHEHPATTSGGKVSFAFKYQAPPLAALNNTRCGLYTFRIWVNNVNGDLQCNVAGDFPVTATFNINVTCGAAPQQCFGAGSCVSNVCNYPATSGGSCDDGDGCTTSDTCASGVCGGGPKNCDDGNKCTVDGCSANNCTHALTAGGTICRDAAGGCDVAEVCVNGNANCPADVKSTAVCRGSTGPCDPAESCDGSSNVCPANTLLPAGTTCRGAVSTCDVAEVCSGSSAACPKDDFALSGTPCRGAAGACDIAETCTGSSSVCPSDVKALAGTTCRGAAGPCDVPETCNGTLPSCPADSFQSSVTVCRQASGVCDKAETCTGSTAACPADTFATGLVCRTAAGICDAAETCNGASPDCPADIFQTSATVCRGSQGACDIVENCTGSGPLCPGDKFQAASTTCRASAGPCDPAETCNGSSPTCPNNGFLADDTACTVDGNPCTIDTCKSGVCNTPVTNGTECTASVCSGGNFIPPGKCSAGSCGAPGAPQACVPLACNANGSACSTSCAADIDCPSGTCDSSQNPKKCAPLLTQGTACLRSTQCASGSCVDGFCCSSGCAGSCQACSVATGATANGTCTNLGASVQCRASNGICDKAETCNGTPDCPSDTFAPTTTVCRASAGLCDVAESCSGSAAQCPPDAAASVVQVCRASAGLCDPQETCNGSDVTCPANAIAPATTVCRSAAGACDAAEFCNGTAVTCPVDSLLTAQTVCRASAGACDVPETCTGASAACPSDVLATSSVVCRPAAGVCDVAEACTGAAAACPTDVFRSTAEVCRPSGGVCDVAETCTGSAATCPADVLKATTVQCTAASCDDGQATGAKSCTGASPVCPPATVQNCGAFTCNGTACRTTCVSDEDCATSAFCTAAGACVPKKTAGQTCAADKECSSTQCTDGVCCNSACTGQCESCAVPGKLGTCSPVSGTPPSGKPVCAGNGSGCDGKCNGVDTQACAMPGENVQCRAPSCAASIATLAEACDGSGKCPGARAQTCDATGCDGTLCKGCKVDGECATGSYCRGGICTTFAGNGEACSRDDECESGSCTDGVCCNGTCDGQCEACNVPGKVGTCSPSTGRPVGSRAKCTGDGTTCGGECDGTHRDTCSFPGYGVTCVEPTCTKGRATIAAFCNGAGQCPQAEVQQCPSACDASGTICAGDCVGTCSSIDTYCSAGVCLPLKLAGEPCNSLSECASSFCVDGVCCDRGCSGQCEACDVPGNEGTCRAVAGAPHGSRQACASDGTTCAGTCSGGTPDRCTYPASERSCRLGSCSNGVADLPATCQGNGSCAPRQQQRCTAAGCNTASAQCIGTCTTDAQCTATQYCSGGICAARLDNGEPCGAPRQCATGACVDGFCCDTGCTGQCEACDVSGKEGTCSPATGLARNGRAACAASGACGGFCDGVARGACTVPNGAVTCGDPYCANGFSTAAATCSNTVCVPPLPTGCDPFQCSPAGGCLDQCATDGDCAEGLVCVDGACVQPPPEVDSGVLPDASAGNGGSAGSGGRSGNSGGRNTAGVDGGTDTGGSPGAGGRATGGGAVTRDAGTDAGHAGGSGSDSGCGCRVSSSRNDISALLTALAVSAAIIGRRRRRGPSPAPRT